MRVRRVGPIFVASWTCWSFLPLVEGNDSPSVPLAVSQAKTKIISPNEDSAVSKSIIIVSRTSLGSMSISTHHDPEPVGSNVGEKERYAGSGTSIPGGFDEESNDHVSTSRKISSGAGSQRTSTSQEDVKKTAKERTLSVVGSFRHHLGPTSKSSGPLSSQERGLGISTSLFMAIWFGIPLVILSGVAAGMWMGFRHTQCGGIETQNDQQAAGDATTSGRNLVAARAAAAAAAREYYVGSSSPFSGSGSGSTPAAAAQYVNSRHDFEMDSRSRASSSCAPSSLNASIEMESFAAAFGLSPDPLPPMINHLHPGNGHGQHLHHVGSSSYSLHQLHQQRLSCTSGAPSGSRV